VISSKKESQVTEGGMPSLQQGDRHSGGLFHRLVGAGVVGFLRFENRRDYSKMGITWIQTGKSSDLV